MGDVRQATDELHDLYRQRAQKIIEQRYEEVHGPITHEAVYDALLDSHEAEIDALRIKLMNEAGLE